MAQPTVSILNSSNAATSMLTFQDASSNNMASVSLDGTRPMYRAAAASAAVITTTTKTLMSIQGSATKTVRITKIGVYISAATAAQCVLQLQRTSALGSGGTTVSPTIAKLDTNFASATAVVSHYTTGAQSQGTAVGGPLTVFGLSQAVTTTAPTFLGALPLVWVFPELPLPSQALVLRGTADFIELQNTTAIGTTPAMSYVVEWIEDGS